jgi:hypothetical protein
MSQAIDQARALNEALERMGHSARILIYELKRIAEALRITAEADPGDDLQATSRGSGGHRGGSIGGRVSLGNPFH